MRLRRVLEFSRTRLACVSLTRLSDRAPASFADGSVMPRMVLRSSECRYASREPPLAR